MENKAEAGGTVVPGMGGFVAGVVVGAAIAGVAALLYAPRSGRETRDRLRAELQETQNMFQCWSEDLRTRMDSFYHVISATINKEEQSAGDGHRPPA